VRWCGGAVLGGRCWLLAAGRWTGHAEPETLSLAVCHARGTRGLCLRMLITPTPTPI
jgi:hypothetical protein